MMKIAGVMLLTSASMGLGVLTNPEKNAQTDADVRKIDVPKKHHDFGKVTHGTILTHTFQVRNMSKTPITIVNVVQTNGSMNYTISNKVLQPSETAELKVTIDTGRFLGEKTLRTRVSLNDGVRTVEDFYSIDVNSQEKK